MDPAARWSSLCIPRMERWLIYSYDDQWDVRCPIYRYLRRVLLYLNDMFAHILKDYQPSKTFSHIQEQGSHYWNVTLLRHGCLAPSPDVISTVYSLRTLELYRRLRLCHPQISVQAFVKVICDLNGVSHFAKAHFMSSSNILYSWTIAGPFGVVWLMSLMSTSRSFIILRKWQMQHLDAQLLTTVCSTLARPVNTKYVVPCHVHYPNIKNS